MQRGGFPPRSKTSASQRPVGAARREYKRRRAGRALFTHYISSSFAQPTLHSLLSFAEKIPSAGSCDEDAAAGRLHIEATFYYYN